MSKRHRIKGTIPREDDPLGFGLKSIPEPLQRLWLLYEQRNLYFEEDVGQERKELAIPQDGLRILDDYDTWFSNRWDRHGHKVCVNAKALRFLESGDLKWPEDYDAPYPCCPRDPLYIAATYLAKRYGVYAAQAEPGFQDVVGDVARYLLLNIWRERRSLRVREPLRGKVPVRETVEVDAQTGQHTVVDRHRHVRIGLDTRGGEGGSIPIWHEWWKDSQRGKTLGEIEDSIDDWYDERSIKRAIDEVERLLKPVTI